MKQYTTSLLLFLLSAFAMHAQELKVKSMQVAQGDLSASTQPRQDLQKNPCGLVKVQLAAAGAKFDGNVIGEAEFKTGEYWVYMTQGSYMLQVKHPNFLPLMVNFRDHGIRGVEPKTTYVLTLLQPQGTDVKEQELVINYQPATAMVLIDSKPIRGNGRVERSLPLGQHSYMIAAEGYITAEGTVKLNGGPAFVLPITLAKENTPSVKETAPAKEEKTTPTARTQTKSLSKDVDKGMQADSVYGQFLTLLGDEYYYGTNRKKVNYAEAASYYRKAAEKGYAKGQFRLGYMYERGYGVTQNYTEAVKWYQKAADQGHEDAKKRLEELNNSTASNQTKKQSEDAEAANGRKAVKVTFETGILFGAGTSTLTEKGKESLSNFANILKSNPDCDVAVYGYSDNGTWKNCTKEQSAQKNQELSQKRAMAVTTYLQSVGVSASQIRSTIGYGEENPVADNSTAVGKAQNRRIEIYLYASEAMIQSLKKEE